MSLDFGQVLIEILILNVCILIGYLVRKFNVISEETTKEMSRFVIRIVFPMYLFKGFIREFKAEYSQIMMIIAIMVFFYLVIALVLGRTVSRFLTKVDIDKRTFTYNTVFGNLAFLGFPICEALFGAEGVFLAAVFVLVQNCFQWTIGINIIRPNSGMKGLLRNIFQPQFCGVLLGIVFYFTQIPLPGPVDEFLTMFGSIAVPLALVITGATLYGYSLKEIFCDKLVQIASWLKTFIFPIIFVTALKLIPLQSFIGEDYAFIVRCIIAIQAAGPLQASSTAFMRSYGGNDRLTARTVFLTTLYCLVSIPLFLWIVQI